MMILREIASWRYSICAVCDDSGRCQVEEFLLDESIFGLLGKLPIHRRCCRKYSSQSMIRQPTRAWSSIQAGATLDQK